MKYYSWVKAIESINTQMHVNIMHIRVFTHIRPIKIKD